MSWCPFIKADCHGSDCVFYLEENKTGFNNCLLEEAANNLNCIGSTIEYFKEEAEEAAQNKRSDNTCK